MSGFLNQFMQSDQGRSFIAPRPTLMSLMQSLQSNNSGSSLSGTSSAGSSTGSKESATKGGAGATSATGAPFTLNSASGGNSGLWPWSAGNGFSDQTDNSLMK